MTDFDLNEIERRLQPYVEEAGRLQGRDITVDRTLALADLVGNPQDRLRAVHVAGTSGKTSTSYYTAALLTAAGQKTGLTVSPHIDSITERFQVDGQPLPDTTFAGYMTEFLELVETALERPTYFELMMVFALWVFDKEEVDYAVVETGLGGLHDSSNICRRADKLAVITDIGLDHMHVLGSTLTEIAQQKLGIVHTDNTIVTHRQADEVMTVVERTAESQSSELLLAKLQVVDDDLPLFQRRNWSLAKTAYDYLVRRDGVVELPGDQLAATQQVNVPARMDIFEVQDKTVVIDGAHNQQKLSACLDSFRQKFPDARPLVIVAVKQGKDIEQMAPLLAGLASQVVATNIEIAQDVPHQSIPTEKVAATIRQHESLLVSEIAGNRAALDYALDQPEPVVLVVGSLYLAATMRQLARQFERTS